MKYLLVVLVRLVKKEHILDGKNDCLVICDIW